jgi:glycosyltransferase involved in cell wall biosynthesis
MSRKPTVLFTLERYDKTGGGVYEVISQIARRFHTDGYNVKIAATTSSGQFEPGMIIENGMEVNRFDIHGSLVNGLRGDIESYKNFLLTEEYDVFVNYAAQQAMTDICFLYADFIDKKKIIIPCGYSGLYWPDFAAYFKALPAYLKHYDAQIFHTINYRDYELSFKNNLQNLYLVPNGFDRNEIENTKPGFREKYGIEKDKKVFLHIGNITGTKGHVEALIVYMLCMIRNSVMVFVGQPLHWRSKHFKLFAKMMSIATLGWRRFIFLEIHPPETFQAFKESDVFLFFSNIEYSPLVLFEAAAAGLPFLASDCGNSKEIAEWSGMGQIVETIKNAKGFSKINYKDAIKQLRLLMSSPVKPVPKKEFLDNFNWDSLYLKYRDVVEKVVK